MKPQLTRWSPATCECQLIEYTDENGVNSFVTHEQALALHQSLFEQYPNSTKNPADFPQKETFICPAHTSIGETKELYDSVLNEGKMMCGLERILLGYDGDDLSLHVEKDGARSFKEGVEFKWRFEGEGRERVLKAEVVGATLTKTHKNLVLSKLQSKEKVELL